jgi:hypothetical protein
MPDGWRPPDRIRRAASMPRGELAHRAIGLGRRVISERRARRQDANHPTYAQAGAGTPLGQRIRALDGSQGGDLTALVDAAGLSLAHRFDLLGSGPVEVRHGMAVAGLGGYRYLAGRPIDPDRAGAWLTGRLTDANLDEARRIWGLVDPGYVPIDWQLDFKSGWRWSGRTWYRDVRFGDRPGADVKVPWELARMQHLPQLAVAHALDVAGDPDLGDPGRYAREFRNQVLDFIATNPPRFGVNWVTAMDVAIRLVNWLLAFDLFRASGAAFDDAFEAVLSRSVLEHGRHVAANLEWSDSLRGNHYLADVAGLLFAGAWLPRGGEGDAWLALGAAELIAEGVAQLLPDGGGFEASTSYHRLSAEMVAWGAAVLLGLSDEERAVVETPVRRGLPGSVAARTRWPGAAAGWRTVDEGVALLAGRLERAAEFSMDVTKPNGRVVQVGDNDSGRLLRLVPEDALDHRSLVRTIRSILPRPDFTAFGGQGPEAGVAALLAGGREAPVAGSAGSPFARAVRIGDGSSPFAESRGQSTVRIEIPLPSRGARANLALAGYRSFGIYVLRSDRVFLAVRCGPVGQNGHGGHAHNDQLSIELSVDGQDWICDPGTYVYTALPERRNACRSAAAHFGPRLADGEPAALDEDLFRLGPGTTAECLAWGPEGFAGRASFAGGRSVTASVRLEDDRVVVTYAFHGCRPHASVVAAARDWRALLPEVPFSPGYGLLESEAGR